MFDIFEIHAKTNVPIRYLRTLEKTGFLVETAPLSKPQPASLSKMLMDMRKGNRLTVLQLATLIDKEDMLFDLGGYASNAQKQIKALGNVSDEIAPPEIVAALEGAMHGNTTSLSDLAEWIKATIPESGEVSHHYLAVRIMLGTKENLRPLVNSQIGRAFLNCKNAELAGWFTLRPISGKRNATFYSRPKLAYDP